MRQLPSCLEKKITWFQYNLIHIHSIVCNSKKLWKHSYWDLPSYSKRNILIVVNCRIPWWIMPLFEFTQKHQMDWLLYSQIETLAVKIYQLLLCSSLICIKSKRNIVLLNAIRSQMISNFDIEPKLSTNFGFLSMV